MGKRELVALALGALGATLGVAGCGGGGEAEQLPAPEEPEQTELEQTPPGSVGMGPMHRLNLVEYRNTLRDLLGTSQDPTTLFPADNVSHGFDNVAESLTLSPVHFQLYEQAASELAREALHGVGIPSLKVEGEKLPYVAGIGEATDDAFAVRSNGVVQYAFATEPGDYTLRLRVWATLVTENGQAEPVMGNILVDGNPVAALEVVETPKVVEVQVTASAGITAIGLELTNDYATTVPLPQDRDLYVDWIELEGPAGQYRLNSFVPCNPITAGCRAEIFETFATRAFRRPVEAREVEALEALVQTSLDDGGTLLEGLEAAFAGVLLSPNFLYRPELVDTTFTGKPQALNDYEIASRLSYFLWSTMPDEALFEAAAAGRLHRPEELRAQVDRMLADPKASALVDNFAGQWLLIRGLATHTPLDTQFPSYDDALRESLRQEMQRFFGAFVSGEVGLDELLTADFSYLDDRLAAHYGLGTVGSDAPVRASVPPERAGLLGKAGILTLTSHQDGTSPVQRGVWILENLLCTEPPPPPPEGEELPEGTTENERELLNQHLADPSCATCHALMDPYGIALENYDAIGRWRTSYGDGAPVDPTTELSSGEPVAGPRELMDLVQADPRLPRCVAEKLFVYGLGRSLQDEDRPHIAQIAGWLAEADYRFPELIKLIVTSPPFLTRRGLPEESP